MFGRTSHGRGRPCHGSVSSFCLHPSSFLMPSPGVPLSAAPFTDCGVFGTARALRAQTPLPCTQGRGWVRGSSRSCETNPSPCLSPEYGGEGYGSSSSARVVKSVGRSARSTRRGSLGADHEIRSSLNSHRWPGRSWPCGNPYLPVATIATPWIRASPGTSLVEKVTGALGSLRMPLGATSSE